MKTARIGRKTTPPREVTIPAFPSKSEAHRLLIAAALSDRETGILCSRQNADMLATADCLSRMGAGITRTADGFCVTPIPEHPESDSAPGTGRADVFADGKNENKEQKTAAPDRAEHPDSGRSAEGIGETTTAAMNAGLPQNGTAPASETSPLKLDVGESGSTLRFLLPVLPALGIDAEITMHGRLPERPLAPLDRVLRDRGITPERRADTLTIRGKLPAGNYEIDGGVSSQFVSGLLFALPLADGDSTLRVTGHAESVPYIRLTLDALRRFSVNVREEEGGTLFRIPGNRPYRSSADAVIPVGGDWSGAAFYLAAGAVGNAPVTVTGLDTESAQGDRAILPLLRKMGARCEVSGDRVTVFPSRLCALETDASDIPDLVPVLAVLGACADGITVLRGVGRLRIKESDRLEAVRELLGTLGVTVQISGDNETLTVTGNRGGITGGTVSSFGDHRIAMSAAVAALAANSPVTVTDAGAVEKSAPDFFEQMKRFAEVEYV